MIGVVVGVKKDNDRLHEYVSHYIDLGFDKCIIIDNNELNDENPLDVLKDFKDKIIYLDRRGDHTPKRQMIYYTQVYTMFYYLFDWLLFVDSDEFLYLNKDKTIQEYLSRPIFRDVDAIHINWKIYNSCDRLFEDPNISLAENYPYPIPVDFRYEYPRHAQDEHIKSFIHCAKRKELMCNHPHVFMDTRGRPMIACNASGIRILNEYPWTPPTFEYAELRHYQLRSVDVFCRRRLGERGPIMFDGTPFIPTDEINRFFAYNERTPEREEYIKNYCKEHNIPV